MWNMWSYMRKKNIFKYSNLKYQIIILISLITKEKKGRFEISAWNISAENHNQHVIVILSR